MHRFWCLLIFLVIPLNLVLCRSTRYRRNKLSATAERESNASYWFQNAQIQLCEQVLKLPNLNVAKNVIFFLGDGMSIPTITASRIYKGQKNKESGEESKLFFEKFPYTGLSKTYCVDKQVADSACSATAYLCGIKGNYATIGVSASVPLDDCTASLKKENQVNSLAVWAQKAGKATGIVTTTRVTHASPSGNYAHTSNRQYESDKDIQENIDKRPDHAKNNCQDIASQLVFNQTGSRFKVILGGGRKKFLPNTTIDSDGVFGERLDGLNLIEYWKKYKKGTATYVQSRDKLRKVNFAETDYLLGLFNSNHMKYNLDNKSHKEPSLMEMTEAAIKILSKEKKGFYLFVEGGRIDHGHHSTKAQKALDETVEFDKAVQKAAELTSEADTLIVVTADHAHTMSVAGYSKRGSDILGLNSEISDIDQLPYMTISYANGPGYVASTNGTREDLRKKNWKDKNAKYPSLFPLTSETHGGDDVGVFARGPWSHLFTGVYEQNVIPHIVAYASCIGDGLTACNS